MEKNTCGGGLFSQPPFKRKILIVLGILIVFLSMIGISYAYWLFTTSQKDFNHLGTACFDVKIENESAGITIPKAYPVTDEEGKKQDGYTFTITNKCSTIAYYQVNLEELETQVKRLGGQYIKASLNDSNGKVLDTYEDATPTLTEEKDRVTSDESHKLTTGSLGPEGTVTYNLKLWMDEATPPIDDVMNATFKSKITVTASYIEEDKRNNTITIVYQEPEDYNKEHETITFHVTGTNYKIIEYSLDGTTYHAVDEPSMNLEFTYSFEEEKEYTIYFRDEMGNIQNETIQINKLDQQGPSIDINESIDTEGVLLNITFKDEKSDLMEYKIEDDISSIDVSDGWISLQGKEQTVEYRAKENKDIKIYVRDVLGNENTRTYSITKLDTTGPVLEINNEFDDTWRNEKVVIQLSATDESGVSNFYYSLDDDTWNVIENTESNGTSATATLEISNNTNATYSFKAEDGLGNSSNIETSVVKVDIDEPTLDSITFDDEWAKTKTLTGTAQDEFSGIYGYEFTTSSEPTGNWTTLEDEPKDLQTFTYEATEKNTYYLHVRDMAGNVGTISADVQTIGSLAPVISAVNPYEDTWTNGTVTITITMTDDEGGPDYCESSASKDTGYSRLSGSFKENTFTVSYSHQRNATSYYRCYDKAGRVSNVVSTKIKIDTTGPVLSMYAGSMMSNDPTFTNNTNEIEVYNLDGNTTLERKEMETQAGTQYGLNIKTTNGTGEEFGGFTFKTPYTSNKVYATRIIAKIPSGYTLESTNDTRITTSGSRWLTDNEGTGEWREYIYLFNNGSANNFNTSNYFYLKGTSTESLEWQVSYASVFDVGTLGVTETYLILVASDDSAVKEYGLSTSRFEEPSYTQAQVYQNRFATFMPEALTGNTTRYWIWVNDKFGNQTKEAFNPSELDLSAPTVNITEDIAEQGDNGWYKRVSLKVTITDDGTGVASAKYCIKQGACTPNAVLDLEGSAGDKNRVSQVELEEDENLVLCVQSIDVVGNTSDIVCSSAYNIDKTPPKINSLTIEKTDDTTIKISVDAEDNFDSIDYTYSLKNRSNVSETYDPKVSNTSVYNFTIPYIEKPKETLNNVGEITARGGLYEVLHEDTPYIKNGDFSTTEYRYAGYDPNNYVSFGETYDHDVYVFSSASRPWKYDSMESCIEDNQAFSGTCEMIHHQGDPLLWRIIGLVNVPVREYEVNVIVKDLAGNEISSKSIIIDTTQRLKIIRSDSIGFMAWDSNGMDNWTKSTLMKYLNTEFYNNLKNDTYKSMIDKDIIWTIGGLKESFSTTAAVYSIEKSAASGGKSAPETTIWSSNNTEAETFHSIGIMYPSDYGYAVGGNDRICIENNSLFHESTVNDYTKCTLNNWLYSGIREWLLAPSTSLSYPIEYCEAYVIDGLEDPSTLYKSSAGSVTDYNVRLLFAVRPVVYLAPNVKIVNNSKDGSSENPYELELVQE